MAQRNIKAGSAYVEIGIRNRISAGAKAVQADLNKLSSSLKNQGQSIMRLGGVLAASVTAPLAIAIRAGSQMQETMGKFNTVFGDAAGEVQAWGETTAAAMGISEQSMMSMLSGMQDLLVPMGVLPDNATNMSKTLSGLAVDLASFNNMSPEKAFEDLMAAMTGSGEVMKKYGVMLSQTAVNQELLNMALDPKRATEAEKAQARLNIIMRGTTAAQGDAVRTSGSFANQMKALRAGASDVAAALGGPLLEGLAGVIGLVNNAVSSFKTFVKENQALVRIVGMGLIAIGGIGVALLGIGGSLYAAGLAFGALATAIGVIFSPLGLAIGGVTALGFALVKYSDIGSQAIDALKARFGPLVEDVQNAVGAIIAALKAGDMEKAWELVSGMIEMIWLDMTDEIRAAWVNMLGFILNTGSTIAESIGQVFQGLASVLETMMSYYKSLYDEIYNAVLDAGGALTGVRTIGERSSGFEANLGGVGSAAQSGIDSLRQFGVAMEDEARGRREQRQQQRDEDAAARQERRQQLGQQMQQEFKAAQVQTDERAKEQKRLNDQIKISAEGLEAPGAGRAGPSGTFSAFAASMIGAAPVEQKVSDPKLLNEQKKAVGVLQDIAKNIKKQNVPAFGA